MLQPLHWQWPVRKAARLLLANQPKLNLILYFLLICLICAKIYLKFILDVIDIFAYLYPSCVAVAGEIVN